MKTKTAFCGLICSECPAYIGTLNGDTAALETLAITWSKAYGAKLSAEDCTCDGCRSVEGPWMSHCSECEIRACGTQMKISTCAKCPDYACEKLAAFLEYVPAAKAVLDEWRSNR